MRLQTRLQHSRGARRASVIAQRSCSKPSSQQVDQRLARLIPGVTPPRALPMIAACLQLRPPGPQLAPQAPQRGPPPVYAHCEALAARRASSRTASSSGRGASASVVRCTAAAERLSADGRAQAADALQRARRPHQKTYDVVALVSARWEAWSPAAAHPVWLTQAACCVPARSAIVAGRRPAPRPGQHPPCCIARLPSPLPQSNLCLDIVVEVPQLPPADEASRRELLRTLTASPPPQQQWEVGG